MEMPDFADWFTKNYIDSCNNFQQAYSHKFM